VPELGDDRSSRSARSELCEAQAKADGLSAEELKDELAVILVQRAYILQLQQNNDAAHDLYQSVLTDKPSDQAVVAVASNNIIATRKKDEKLFDSLKVMHGRSVCPLEGTRARDSRCCPRVPA
jgi:hypothetical protein